MAKAATKPTRPKGPKREVATKAPVKLAAKATSARKGAASGARWNDDYTSGAHKRWTLASPSQELVGVIATLGLVPGSAALDVGCGAGVELVFLAKHGFRAIGLDVAPKALELAATLAKKAAVEVELLEGSAVSIPLDADAVDLVNDRGLLQHLSENERGKYAREVARVLRPGGVLVLRGARVAGDGVVAVSAQSLDRHFDRRYFRFGPLLEVELDGPSGRLPAHMVILRRTADLFGTHD
jgi:SAM-dependent methyltransferase